MMISAGGAVAFIPPHCPECQEQVRGEHHQCPHCAHTFTALELAQMDSTVASFKKRFMSWGLFLVLLFLIFVIVGY